MTQGQLNQAYPQVFVTGVPTPLAVGKFKDLAPEQLGLFTASELGVVSVATGSEDGDFQIAQGLHDFAAKGKTFGGGVSNAPRKTKKFKATDITAWRGIKSNRKHQGQIVALGYDGVDSSKRLSAMVDVKDLIVNIRLWGNMVSKVMGNRNSMPISILVNKGCLSLNCDANSIVADETIADSIISQVNTSFLTQGYKMTDLITVRKIKKYAVNPAAPTNLLQFHKFSTTICDDGSISAVGLIQAQYNTLDVKRIKRDGSFSTYEVFTQDGGVSGSYTNTVPAVVSLSARTVAECEICPTGSTKVDSAKAYELKALASTAAPVMAGSTSVTLIGTDGVTKTYLVIYPDTASDTTVATNATTAGYTSRLVSTTRDICNFPASTYAWTVGVVATKAPHDWKITLSDDTCGTDRLAALQANYPGYTVAIDATGTCVHTYKITNYSDSIEPGCYPDDYRYSAPSAFEGIQWKDFTVTLLAPDCSDPVTTYPCVAVGVIFESKVEEAPVLNEYTFLYAGNDVEKVDATHIQVSVQSLDVNSNVCDEPSYPVTRLQNMVYPKGQGSWVMGREIHSKQYEGYRLSNNPIINQKFGMSLSAKDGKFYDEYQLEYKESYLLGGWSKEQSDNYLTSFYFEEGQGKQFEALINGLIAKQGVKIKPVYL